ncbi:molybdopterin-guanine dinucleotide biosynthesis protein B [Saccharibacillus sp. O23]|uniref:molybdopterin-guanine dinucleotide biosynthesis protein B n=1 Tax=Saccharibacillus sp. O23 TaxID=2009338 RepID=UPI000B4E68EA|nr:molybdopterin-guanine dinucleotide biosynthesis protein B [Saccharibacillus sp. O23]OWR32602.1 molybdopterin-guanine dinucleotide biosynthesis protein B [Saccharibacillus sp. O23]
MGSVKRLQVVGFKNSGKTTLTERLLHLAAERGLRASAIKHHGHGGAPEPPPGGTDASRFFAAGAASSLVVGGGVLLLQGREPSGRSDVDREDGREEGELDRLIRLTEAYAEPDLVLIEGFKQAAYDKIVLLRSEEDLTELLRLPGIRLIIVPDEELRSILKNLQAQRAEVSRFGALTLLHREDADGIANWFGRWLKGEPDETL